MLRGLFVLISVALGVLLFHVQQDKQQDRWTVYYGSALAYDAFHDFNVIVFDSERHPPIKPLKHSGKMVLGYLSLGEADPNRDYYYIFARGHLLLPKTRNMSGHNVIDIRKPQWGNYVINDMIPSIVAQGFDGIMIDTLDSVIQPEMGNPHKYAGMHRATVKLIKRIHNTYPSLKIMVNRGFEILPYIAEDIDMVLAESTYSTVSPQSGKYVVLQSNERLHYLEILHTALQRSPALKVYSLDYWPQSDMKGIKDIYAAQRRSGFIPYVTTMDLQAVHKEP